jgi:very-short-patch-repair endonuclease
MREFRYVKVAGRQHGVLRGHEIDLPSSTLTRAVQTGRLTRHYRDVYSPLPQLSREGEWLAAVFAAGDGAGLAALNAAVVWEISRFKPNGITVAVPTRRRPQGFMLIVGLDPRDVRVRNGIPVTTVDRVLIDSTRELLPEQIANLMHEAAFRGRLSIPALRRTMDRTAAKRKPRLEQAIAMHLAGSTGTRSNLEDRFMALVRQAKLPVPVVNTRIHGVEVDFRWGDYCVEADGPNHDRPATRAKDRADEETLRGHGLTVVRFSAHTIDHEPRVVLHELANRRQRPRAA